MSGYHCLNIVNTAPKRLRAMMMTSMMTTMTTKKKHPNPSGQAAPQPQGTLR